MAGDTKQNEHNRSVRLLHESPTPRPVHLAEWTHVLVPFPSENPPLSCTKAKRSSRYGMDLAQPWRSGSIQDHDYRIIESIITSKVPKSGEPFLEASNAQRVALVSDRFLKFSSDGI